MEGIGRYTKEIITHLVSAQTEDDIHIILDRDYQPAWLQALPVTIHVIRPPARHPWLWYFWYEISMPRLLARIQPDVLFCPEGYLSKRAQVPTLMTIHDLANQHFSQGTYASHIRYLNKNIPSFIDRADAIITVSGYTRREVMKTYSEAKEKTSVIHHGVGKEFRILSEQEKTRVRHDLTGGRPYFLYLGALHPRKNIIRLIEAFEAYRERPEADHFLVLAGRLAWKSEEIKKKLEHTHCKDYIIYESEIDGRIPEILGAATALCYVSLLEGFGLPVLEAMACGTPVITSKDSAMQEVCDLAAIYVNPHRVKEISEAMIVVTRDPILRARLVDYGVERSNDFTWEDAAEKVYDLLSLTAESKKA